MAYPAETVGPTQADNFTPELWSDEIIAAYKANLVLAALVTNFNHNGKKGDKFNVPAPTRGSASVAPTGGSAVTLIQNTEGTKPIEIDKHYEYSRLIEDIVSIQATDSLRQFYTDDAGFALATVVDTQLHGLGNLLQGGAGTAAYDKAVIGSDGTTSYVAASNNEEPLADAGIRKVIQTLDDANIPQRDRYLVIPPVEKNNLLGLARFTEQAFVGEVGMANSIRNGRIGNVYGVEVFVSTQCASGSGTGTPRICLLFHKSAFGLVMQRDVRVQTQYKQEYLSDLMTGDVVFGVGELRDDGGVAIAVDD